MAGFDPLGDLQRDFATGLKIARWSARLTNAWRAKQAYKAAEAEYGPEVADAVQVAVAAGKDPQPILQRAERARQERAERERLLANPPPLYGSASWATTAELGRFLKGRDGFDHPSSLLLGSYVEPGQTEPAGFVHWDDDGHLLTVAPTRSGKAVTTIIPNLLRYRGSCIVLDPKGELYAATSKWRADHVGPVYRIAPFDDGSNPATAGWPRHSFNPLARVRSQSDARALAELLFPRDPKASEFFSEDAAAFMTGVILFVLHEAPPARRHLATVREITAQPTPELKKTVERMARSSIAAVAEAAANVLGKSGDRGLPNLRDTLHAKLSLWSDPAIQAALQGSDVRFEALKDAPATVYLEVPFDLMEPYAPFLRVVLKSALDAMLRNPAVPAIPVLFLLDEFLALGPFPEFRNAIRTHAGAGVRLWFFLQDLGSLEENYPGAGWKAFFNTAARQFFGIDDPFTAQLISQVLGTTTLAHLSTTAGGGYNATIGDLFTDGGAGFNFSSGESVQVVGRPLLPPDDVVALLSGWKGDGWRHGIVQLRGPRPFQVCLVAHSHSAVCRARLGAYLPSPPKASPENPP